MNLSKYQRAAVITITATLILIFVGGLVRAAGAGLGCPDWPHCFGSWIPPTDASQLPAEFDASKFNVFQTWTEYINRLVGVIVGLLIFWTLVRSFSLRKEKPVVFWGSLLAFILVGFQGWLGGVVVKTELEAWIITTHMITALVIVSLLIYTAFLGSKEKLKFQLTPLQNKQFLMTGVFMLASTLTQIVIGTQVREGIDIATKNFPEMPRTDWLAQVGTIDFVHRISAFGVLAIAIYLFAIVNKMNSHYQFQKLARINLNLVVLQMAFGIGLAYFGMPAPLQVLHLFFASLTVCIQFFFILLVKNSFAESNPG